MKRKVIAFVLCLTALIGVFLICWAGVDYRKNNSVRAISSVKAQDDAIVEESIINYYELTGINGETVSMYVDSVFDVVPDVVEHMGKFFLIWNDSNLCSGWLTTRGYYEENIAELSVEMNGFTYGIVGGEYDGYRAILLLDDSDTAVVLYSVTQDDLYESMSRLTFEMK